uniref:Uncharacterized protein n=1 Tax=Oryza meridionalis TaxID=40149 RepID=A0A0E0C523_9ORYZ
MANILHSSESNSSIPTPTLTSFLRSRRKKALTTRTWSRSSPSAPAAWDDEVELESSEELVPHGTPTKKDPLVAPPPPPPPPNNQESESDSDSDDDQKSDSSDDEALPVPNPALQANKNVPPSDDDEDDDQESDSGDAQGR